MKENVNSPRRTRWAWAIATFFGAGFLRPGPGTYGSAAATLLWLLAAHAARPRPLTLVVWTAAAAVAATAIGIPAATIAARESGREDPGFVVIDEVAGQWFTLLAARPDWRHAALAFVLFRLLDITKPWPIRRLEALPEGTGILLDDVAAGLLAAVALAILSAGCSQIAPALEFDSLLAPLQRSRVQARIDATPTTGWYRVGLFVSLARVK